jgi:hypothetical protein
MRILITASGIQDYIFNISKSKATARLRGRSALLGLVTDVCLLRLKKEFGDKVEEKRNAGSRLEVEIAADVTAVKQLVQGLRGELDNYAAEMLDGQVWFAIAEAEDSGQIHADLAERKLRPGQATLQEGNQWKEDAFVFDRKTDERALEERTANQAMQEPDARLGASLARAKNTLIELRGGQKEKGKPRILKYNVDVKEGPNELHVQIVDEDGPIEPVRKRMARHAPLDKADNLLDLSEIAEKSQGAKFLGVLKADLDGLGKTFSGFGEDQEKARKLSKALEVLFTEELEDRMKKNHPLCYIVYSGGDDLFILGPWDQLIRFIAHFEQLLRQKAEEWELKDLSLSAGFKLAHPKSPIRYLSEDAEAALKIAKEHCNRGDLVPHKNCICIFERILDWNELREGLELAGHFIEAAGAEGLSIGFLQRFQYYASQFQRFFMKDQIDGLRALPLLQNDWRRNIGRVEDGLRARLDREVLPFLVELTDRSAARWRTMEFASQFTVYALREKR